MPDLPDDHRDEFRDGSQPPSDAPQPRSDQPPPPAPTPQPQWPQPHARMTTSEQRNWAVGAHLGALAASMVTGLSFLGPLVVYLVKKDEDAFVREHARESLNFQLTWLIGAFVATVLGVIAAVVTVGFALIVLVPVAIGFLIAWVVFMVKASMAASRGEHYRYPLTIRIVS